MSDLHVSEDQLTDYLLGRLADAEHAAVEEHLDQCSNCEQRAAAATPRDRLVGLLASVDGSDSATSRVDGEAAVPQSKLSPTSASNIADSMPAGSLNQPPEELLKHARYRVIRPLGAGGMGTVWLAEHLVMQRQVALKAMRPEWISKVGALERFSREVHAAAKLNHVNVVHAYDAERIGDMLFLVAEYVYGETLAELLLDGPLTVAEACRAVRDAACGLAHAHASGLVHRDVKPSNLIRSRAGVVKILDFGLVPAFRGDSSLTGANMLVGTPDYVAPEQAEDPTRADARSDIYSLGCTLYHLLGGEPPFTAVSTLRKLDAHRYTEPPRLTQIPAMLQQILSRMMAKNPNDRFQSATDVSEALRPYCKEPQVVERKPAAKMPSRRAAILSAVVTVVGLAMLLGYWFYDGAQATTDSQEIAEVTPSERLAALPSPTRTFPLLTPTAIGDGRREDFQIVDSLLKMDAMHGSPQLWLNYDVVRSRAVSIFAKVRFVETGRDANLKFVFLADHVGDYSLQVRPDEQRFEIHHALGFEATVLGKHETPSEFGSDWIDVEFRLRGDRLTAVIDGWEILSVACDGAARYYPCVSALHCVVELREPHAVVAE